MERLVILDFDNVESIWAVLNDEQMSNGYPFSLLNDEQRVATRWGWFAPSSQVEYLKPVKPCYTTCQCGISSPIGSICDIICLHLVDIYGKLVAQTLNGTGILTYIWLICMVNVGKYTIH